MDDNAELMFVGSGRTIVALDRFSGRPLWRRKLPRMFGGFMTIIASEREVYVGRGGYVYCLDARSGEPIWERGLGAGGGMVMMTMHGQSTNDLAVVAAIQAQQAAAAGATAAAAAAASTG